MEQENLHSPSHSQDPKVILLLDDERNILVLLSRILGVKGYRAYGMQDKQHALTWMLEHIPDLIITDLQSPRMNGFEFLRTMRKHPLFKDIPVIMLSGNDNLGTVIEAVRLGVSNYLTKPCEIGQLTAVIEKTIGGPP